MRKTFFMFVGALAVGLVMGPVLGGTAHALTGEGTAGASLTEEQKNEKRLLFSQYVEEELARREKKKYEERAKQPETRDKFTLINKATALYGYDSNANLDSSRRGDVFHQDTVEGAFKIDRPEFKPFVWPGKIGITWSSEYLDYDSNNSLDSHITTVTGLTEERLSDKFSLKFNYDFSVVRYLNNDQSNYFGNKLKTTLAHNLTNVFSHSFFAAVDSKNFRDRKSSTVENLPSDDNRRDWGTEIGYGARLIPRPTTFIGVTTALKTNQSSDSYNDYNDYDSWKLNGYVYHQFNEKFSAVGFSGYDHKAYDNRRFLKIAGDIRTEEDDFYYAGGYLYYDLTKHWQATVQYLYKENLSNDASQEYTGYTLNTGLSLIF
ncbi:MAG: hypothetical protein HYT89_01825 [Candidatus Omnitrophica bacterium]|nr:hypothetical protein [Candidatus Omnitrophota bacterium]